MFVDRAMQFWQDFMQPHWNPGKFVAISSLILNFIRRGEGPRRANSIWKEKKKVGGLVVSDFKTYSKATIIKTVWFWQKNRQIDQWKRLESPEIDSYKYSRLIFNKAANAIQWN